MRERKQVGYNTWGSPPVSGVTGSESPPAQTPDVAAAFFPQEDAGAYKTAGTGLPLGVVAKTMAFG